ncbi:hypothetical protein [Candidatus Absconditicoccus praedator]|uniref:hypothetical protein n=1 Tax=Candidatus Absconditicoccus praedator TaxID=2735562 RepID=UPI001E2B9D87|nr:hypothetical protein [Candidatus Absconditicoccus praedator]UFX82562.1 hypothetical protein HLG78_00215 [Candidatus Absconditicoccus praedator]
MKSIENLYYGELKKFPIESEYIERKKVELIELLDSNSEAYKNHGLFDILTGISVYIELIGFAYATRYGQNYSKMLTKTLGKLNQII